MTDLSARAGGGDAALTVRQRLSMAFPGRLRTRALGDLLAKSITEKDERLLALLVQGGLTTIFNRAIEAVDANAGFINALDKSGETDRSRYPHLYGNEKTAPLVLAVIKGFEEGAKILLAAGAKPFEKAEHILTGYTGALGAAIFRGDEAMIKLLMSQETVKQELQEEPKFRNYLLHVAILSDNDKSLKTLIACDAGFVEKARAYGTLKATDVKLGDGIKRAARPSR
jgi:hypothetical protein